MLVARRGVPAASPRAWWLLLGAAVLVAALVASASLSLEGRYWTSPPPATLFRTATAAMGLLLVAAAVTIPAGVMRHVPRVFSYLGEISYGIYLWHMPVLVVLLRTTELRGGALALATFAGTVALSALTWHAMEKPLIAVGRRLTRVG